MPSTSGKQKRLDFLKQLDETIMRLENTQSKPITQDSELNKSGEQDVVEELLETPGIEEDAAKIEERVSDISEEEMAALIDHQYYNLYLEQKSESTRKRKAETAIVVESSSASEEDQVLAARDGSSSAAVLPQDSPTSPTPNRSATTRSPDRASEACQTMFEETKEEDVEDEVEEEEEDTEASTSPSEFTERVEAATQWEPPQITVSSLNNKRKSTKKKIKKMKKQKKKVEEPQVDWVKRYDIRILPNRDRMKKLRAVSAYWSKPLAKTDQRDFNQARIAVENKRLLKRILSIERGRIIRRFVVCPQPRSWPCIRA